MTSCLEAFMHGYDRDERHAVGFVRDAMSPDASPQEHLFDPPKPVATLSLLEAISPSEVFMERATREARLVALWGSGPPACSRAPEVGVRRGGAGALDAELVRIETLTRGNAISCRSGGMRIAFGLAVMVLAACSSGSKDGDRLARGGGAGSGGSSPGGSGGSGSSLPNPGGAGSAQGGSNGAGGAQGSSSISLPRVYPLVRAATPTELIANPNYAALPFRQADSAENFGTARQALAGGVSLASVVRDRFYSGGPTELLRIVSALDGRVQGLDLTAAAHPCLSTPPIAHTYSLPGGQTFEVKLQCLQQFGTPGANAGWVAFGVERREPVDGGASVDDAGVSAADASAAIDGSVSPTDGGQAIDPVDVYLVEGQEGGNGGAYRIDERGNVEGWIAVAERNIPSNSQVIMHLWTDAPARTLELALAGSGVGFCAAHLQTDPTFLFISGKTNAPPPPGTMMSPGMQYCDATRAACYRADDLATDLGSDSESCAAIGPSSFDIGVELDSDTSEGANPNVVTSDIYSYFSEMPTGVPTF
jgi:hypothetical protein